MALIGIIGGSGLYDLKVIQDKKWVDVDTEFGAPSDQVLTGYIGAQQLAFIPRHRRGHVFSPTSVPYKANIAALKKLGAKQLLSFSACGSLNENMKPGDFVVVDQYVDRTVSRDKSFFGTGAVGHVSLAEPVCKTLSEFITVICKDLGVTVHGSGTYVAIEGPQFSTKAESILYKEVWKCDVIGMTNVPEMNLAREAGLCYASVAMVTDFDCWNDDHGNVTVEEIIATMNQNSTNAQTVLAETLKNFGKLQPCSTGCQKAAEYALITKSASLDPATLERLKRAGVCQ